MLLRSYRKEIFRAKCNPSFESVHCIAHLEEDIGKVLPYLNTVLGGFSYIEDPSSLTLLIHGRLITLHPREIAINALEDEAQAEKILRWLMKENQLQGMRPANLHGVCDPRGRGHKRPRGLSRP